MPGLKAVIMIAGTGLISIKSVVCHVNRIHVIMYFWEKQNKLKRISRMFKKLILISLMAVYACPVQADLSSFFGALLGSLFGSELNSPQQQPVAKATPAPSAPVMQAKPYVKMCASGCDTPCEVSLNCGHCMCNSCLISARHSALMAGTNLTCRTCSKTIEEYKPCQPAVIGHQANTSNQLLPNDRAALAAKMCASGCYSKCEVNLSCGHCICKSCLRSRLDKAQKSAGGGEPYVTCPEPNCGDMLNNHELNQARSAR